MTSPTLLREAQSAIDYVEITNGRRRSSQNSGATNQSAWGAFRNARVGQDLVGAVVAKLRTQELLDGHQAIRWDLSKQFTDSSFFVPLRVILPMTHWHQSLPKSCCEDTAMLWILLDRVRSEQRIVA